jgi:hypothetical protein
MQVAENGEKSSAIFCLADAIPEVDLSLAHDEAANQKP